MKRGYFGIGVYHPKDKENIGSLWRSAQNFGANFIFVIGKRYKKQATDTTKAYRHVPLYEYADMDDFVKHLPRDCKIVFVEQAADSRDLVTMVHPQCAAYVLGAEDYGIPEAIMNGHPKVSIDTPMCLNVAVAGSIVLYDRACKQSTRWTKP